MSEKYPGGLITKTPVTPTGPYQNGTASGVWTRDQQLQYQKQGIWPIAGNVPLMIEDVFSTWLYTGNGATQNVTNGINLSANGGLTWIKSRSAAEYNSLFDTARGVNSYLFSNATNGNTNYAPYGVTAFNSNGFSISGGSGYAVNTSAETYVSWTFRKQPKFFDVVTWTGNGAASQTISHNLGSVPGCILAKRTSSAGSWYSYHSGIPTANNKTILLNTTGAALDLGVPTWNPTSTTFTADETQLAYNTVGSTYVAYLFASNAGGFGLSGTDNVITCGSFSTDSSGNASVTLGYEPQWIMAKASSGTISDWYMYDNMRGLDVSNGAYLRANGAAAETAVSPMKINATGFSVANSTFDASSTYIYIAIRRGPMATPTDATKVFIPITSNASTGTVQTTNFPVDFQLFKNKSATDVTYAVDRLRGISTTPASTATAEIYTPLTSAEGSYTGGSYYWNNVGFGTPSDMNNFNTVYWNFRRAPGFFDEVCYTGTGSATTVTHNLGVAPELMIVKDRSSALNWTVYSAPTAATAFLRLNTTDAAITSASAWNNTSPTSSVFTIGTGSVVNASGENYVAYLFATCANVSKVGSYTGNGSTQTINCGFTGGARFVLIRRTDSTGDWYVYDTARGMTTLTDPYLLLNTTAPESATLGSVTTVSTGFAVNAAVLAAINTNAATYIFLAIA
jgi:hypothetical protein